MTKSIWSTVFLVLLSASCASGPQGAQPGGASASEGKADAAAPSPSPDARTAPDGPARGSEADTADAPLVVDGATAPDLPPPGDGPTSPLPPPPSVDGPLPPCRRPVPVTSGTE